MSAASSTSPGGHGSADSSCRLGDPEWRRAKDSTIKDLQKYIQKKKQQPSLSTAAAYTPSPIAGTAGEHDGQFKDLGRHRQGQIVHSGLAKFTGYYDPSSLNPPGPEGVPVMSPELRQLNDEDEGTYHKRRSADMKFLREKQHYKLCGFKAGERYTYFRYKTGANGRNGFDGSM
eukprot:NODE_1446_length_968_cov_104.926007_g997_i0.p1 GENE.NODE_1446_length_968_cov_104.926007_g997_i0~~NODE_1446_length_968_cov_104.926007_g997_i0.p1  ORF type:complete len:174 (+),score=45.63 NODE_1446_length_968_cov_104.926007_g997_i0:131-652(+)